MFMTFRLERIDSINFARNNDGIKSDADGEMVH